MFEHLDDTEPYAPPAGLLTTVTGRVRRRRRRRVAVAGGVASIAALGVGAVTVGRDRVTPQQIDVAVLPPEEQLPEPGEPVTVLLVGIDSHGDPARDAAEQRVKPLTDTIVVGRVDPEAGELRTLVVPRDLEVADQPGSRFSSLLSTGGPDRLIVALRDQLGIEVDHYVEVDFAGFRRGVDTLGGLRVSVPGAVRAASSGLELSAGCQTIDGDQALALARARRDVTFQASDGTWEQDHSGDYGRQDRVGVLAAALLRAVAEIGPTDLPRLVLDGLHEITVDDSLEVDDIVALARHAGAAQVVPLRLPVTEAPPGGPALLGLADGAAETVDALMGTSPPSGAVGGDPVRPVEQSPVDPTGLAPC